MRKIAITYPEFFAGEQEAVVSILKSGEYWRLHIRKPEADEESLRALIEAIPREYYSKISLHDRFDLAVEYGLGGIHLNSRSPRPIEGWAGLVSRSIHSKDEIDQTGEDYVFLSPIFPSVSKRGYKGDFNLADLKPKLNDRIFALGGVTPERITELESYGFTGAAMLGCLWNRPIDLDAFKLQFITHPSSRMSLAEEVESVLRGGGKWIQLRHKDAEGAELLTEGLEIGNICSDYGATFIVDDHVELVDRLGADGVHLGKNDMPVSQAREILGPGKIIGATANEFADIEKAWIDGADYIGLGPFRFTTTKARLSPILGLEGYLRIVAQCRDAGITLPIVAIGGITESDLSAVMSAGVSGVAISSEILKASSPEAKTKEILKCLKT
ncbi:MAG: thiamine phosphate synthase [Muribaculaceae bacterium]|nr:thiamine phosphate synthase [Muribaculaceae bacterium]